MKFGVHYFFTVFLQLLPWCTWFLNYNLKFEFFSPCLRWREGKRVSKGTRRWKTEMVFAQQNWFTSAFRGMINFNLFIVAWIFWLLFVLFLGLSLAFVSLQFSNIYFLIDIFFFSALLLLFLFKNFV
jgi:hypothetical protein